jgi:hypothetical protein
MPPLGPSALTPSLYATLNYNRELQLIFTQLFVPASAVSPLTKSTPNTNSAPGLSLLWIWSLNSRQIMFGTITKQEIDATQALISAPLTHFLDFRDFCSNIHLNYEFLTATGHAIPELTRIDSFTASIEPFTQFDSYLMTWTTSNALGSRTLASLTKFLLEQYGDMSTENAPRGGNAFYVGKYKGENGKCKGKDQDKGKGRGSKRNRDADNNGTSLSSFASPSSNPPAKQARLTSNTTPALTAEHNPSKPYPTVTAGSTDEISPIMATNANGSSNPTTRRASTSPTSNNPPGNAYIEPAYKSW